MQDLKKKTIRAATISVIGQGVTILLRMVSVVVLARLLTPNDYGLVGMVTAFTGLLNMLGGLGLFQAAVQRESLTSEQASTLFWMNLALGALLTLSAVAMAPFVSAFYHEPRLFAITCVLAAGFILTSAGVQHGALLQRQMRFGISAFVEVSALLIATTVAVGMAMSGYGYWAIVSTSITIPLMSTAGLWLATRWIPGRPHRNIGIGSFVHFGGTMTVTGFVSYFGFNIDKLLLGRFWGAEVMGIYGRAYHLIMMPIDNLNASVGDVAFAALSRTGTDPVRAKRYFLKGYSLIVALTLPLTLTCALFADELIAVLLGPKWEQAADILRILAPMILVFAIANPLGWLLNSRGMVKRNLQIALISAPLMIIGVVVALPYGAKGVAVAFSTVMLLKLVPITAFALIGTGIRISEIFVALVQPLAACLAAAAIVFAIRSFYEPVLPLVLKLGVDVGLFGSLYLCILLCISGRQSIYIDLLRETKAIAAR